MDINGSIIVTPYDNPLEYPPDWRYLVARAWADNPRWTPRHYPEIRKDKHIKGFRDFLSYKHSDAVSERPPKHYRAYNHIFDWHTGGATSRVRHEVEPLLLTGETFDTIAKDIGSGPIGADTFRLYERIYFNIRNDDGSLNQSCHLRTSFAYQDVQHIDAETPRSIIWRLAGAQFGYTGLAYLWRWREPHGELDTPQSVRDELMRHLQAQLMENILRGRINNFDLTAVLGQYINQERMERETGKEASSTHQVMDIAMGLLAATKPHILAASQDVDDIAAANEQLNKRMGTQEAATGSTLPDIGKEAGQRILDDKLQKAFTGKVDNVR